MEKRYRTIVYIDGFNLYYGVLKGTPYKWLDLQKLCSLLLPNHEILSIKYFTARVSGKSSVTQDVYLRALKSYISNIEVYYGHFLTQIVTMEEVETGRTVRVYKREEKGSDVNLAVHLVNDASKGKMECAVLISNDSDLFEALRIAKEGYGVKIGILFPSRKVLSQKLLSICDFKKRIRKGALSLSQLPEKIPNSNIKKPDAW